MVCTFYIHYYFNTDMTIDVLLNTIAGLEHSDAATLMARPFAVEASWVTGKWDKLNNYIPQVNVDYGGDFNIGIGSALHALREKKYDQGGAIINTLRNSIARGLSASMTTSLQACHDIMLRFHILAEIEVISGVDESVKPDLPALLSSLDQRLNVLGAFFSDKQYLLGLRRAAMQLSRLVPCSNSEL